jgi:hypothetical protein
MLLVGLLTKRLKRSKINQGQDKRVFLAENEILEGLVLHSLILSSPNRQSSSMTQLNLTQNLTQLPSQSSNFAVTNSNLTLTQSSQSLEVRPEKKPKTSSNVITKKILLFHCHQNSAQTNLLANQITIISRIYLLSMSLTLIGNQPLSRNTMALLLVATKVPKGPMIV